MCFYCLNRVRIEVAEKRFLVRVLYLTCNIAILVVKRLVTQCGPLLVRVRIEALSIYFIPYIKYKTKTGIYEHRIAQNGFAPWSQRKALIPSTRLIRSGGEDVDEIDAGRDEKHDHAMSHFAYRFFRKLKEIVCHNRVYKEEDGDYELLSIYCPFTCSS